MRKLIAGAVLVVVAAGAAWLASQGVEDDRTVVTDTAPSAGADATPEAGPNRKRVDVPASTAASIVGVVRRDGQGATARVEVAALDSVTSAASARRAPSFQGLLRASAGSFVGSAVLRTVESDADGGFVVAEVPPGTYLVTAVGARAERTVARVVVTADGPEPSSLILDLPHGAVALEGRVSYADGSPFRGHVAPLVGDVEGAIFDEQVLGALPWRAVDDAGQFAFTGLGPGSARVAAIEPGRRLAFSETITLPRDTPFEFRLIDAGDAVSGRVVEAGTGDPVPDAVVVGMSRAGSREGAAEILRVRTGIDGSFSLAGVEMVLVSATGFGSAFAPANASGEELVIELARTGVVRGRVLRTDDDQPQGGALVHVRYSDRAKLNEPPAPVVSGPDGAFAVTGVVAGDVTVFVLGGGWASVGLVSISERGANPLAIEAEAGGEATIDLQVERSGTIDVRVVDQAARPIAGAIVTLRPGGSSFDGLSVLPAQFVGGSDGLAHVPDVVPDATYRVFVEHPEHTSANLSEARAAAGETRIVDVVMNAARTLRLRVTDAQTGAPVGGATVSWREPGASRDTSCVTDAEGIAAATPAPTAKTLLEVSARGYLTADFVEVPAEDAPGAAAPVEVRLQLGLVLAGRVVPPDGISPEGAMVEIDTDLDALVQMASFDQLPMTLRMAPARCDAEGRFRFEGLPRVPVILAARARHGGVVLAGSVKALPGRDDVEIPLLPVDQGSSEKLTVRVLDDHGRPVPVADFRHLRRSVSSSSSSGTTLQSGSTRITHSPIEGERQFIIIQRPRDAGGRALPVAGAIVEIEGDPGAELEIVLEPELTITGRVVDPDGEGVRGVRVKAYLRHELSDQRISSRGMREGDAWSEALTGTDGSYRIAQLVSGEYDLVFRAPLTFAPVPARSLVAGTSGVDVALVVGDVVRVTVVDADGAPLEGARVTASGEGHNAVATSGADGVATLSGLAPGSTCRLRVALSGNDSDDAFPYVDHEWRPADVQVRLERAYVIEGVVHDPGGEPVPRAMVERRDGSGWRGSGTDADGRFRITDLRAGEVVRLRAAAPLGGPGVAPGPGFGAPGREDADADWTDIRAGDRAVVLTFDPGAELVVRVVGWSPAMSGTQFQVHDATGRRGVLSNGTMPADGVVRLAGLDANTRCHVGVGPTPTGRYGIVEDVAPTTRGHDLRLVQGDPLDGRVVVPSGIDAEGVSIRASGEYSIGRVETDADGRFNFPGLPPGTHKLVAIKRTADGVFHAEIDAHTGETVELRLEPR